VNKLKKKKLNPRYDLKNSLCTQLKCTTMESINTWQKIYEENKDGSKPTTLYIYFIKASFCTAICKTENKGCP
jgi:hypothetical protein